MRTNQKSVGFITYCRTVTNSYLKNGFFKLESLPVILVTSALFFLMQFNKSDVYLDAITLVLLFNAALMLSAECSRIARENKPELSLLMPIEYKKRAIYECLSGLILSVCMLLIIVGGFFIILMLPGIFASCVLVDFGIFLEFVAMFENLAVDVGLSGILFLVVYSLLTYGVSLVYGNIKTFSARMSAICGYGVIMIALILILRRHFTHGGIIAEFSNMTNNYLVLAFFALVAIAFIVYGFNLSLKNHKPESY